MNPHEIRKAITALVVPIVVALIARTGFDAGPDIVAGLTAVVSAVLVWAVPNRSATEIVEGS